MSATQAGFFFMAFFSASVGMAVTEAARSSEARTAKHMRELKTILFCRVAVVGWISCRGCRWESTDGGGGGGGGGCCSCSCVGGGVGSCRGSGEGDAVGVIEV